MHKSVERELVITRLYIPRITVAFCWFRELGIVMTLADRFDKFDIFVSLLLLCVYRSQVKNPSPDGQFFLTQIESTLLTPFGLICNNANLASK